MPSNHFTTTFAVPQSPGEVFDAINNVRGWWTGEIDGRTDAVGDEFSYRYPGAHYTVQRVAELEPDKRVVWHVVEAQLEGGGDPTEWAGTDLVFEIESREDATEVRFSHLGLVPDFGCFDRCSSAWGFFINGSLQHLITTGDGPTRPPWE